MKEFSDPELMELLRGVSRSFVLTIRALPKRLRRPIGLAYLLARASDTIADTATAPAGARIECLRAFAAAPAGDLADTLPHLAEIRPENPAEQTLLANLGRVTGAAGCLPAEDRAEIVALLAKITLGQELDLLRFPNPGELRALETAAELDEYTYLVAGCVGEFWTRICGAHLARYSRIEIGELCRLGRNFGQGLQLVNILRDVPEDVRNGRCYLPMAELRGLGITSPEQLRGNLPAAAPVFENWRRKALGYQADARRYIEGIRPLRIRFACLVPWALALRTLNLLGEQSPLETAGRVKVSRQEVTRIMRRAVWAALSNGALGRFEAALAQCL